MSVRRFHTAAFRRGWSWALLLGLVIALLTMGLARYDLLREFELRTLDARFRFRGNLPVTSPLAIVFIGDDSIEEFGRWPWPWDTHALMIDTLQRAGAKHILFDIFFTEPPNAQDARMLGEVAGRAGNVYFCSFFNRFTHEERADSPLLRGEELNNPVPEIIEAAAGVGHCNALPDIDGITRRVPLVVRHGDKNYPAALLKLAGAVLDVPIDEVRLTGRNVLEARADGDRSLTVPIDQNGQTMANFTGGLEAFPSYSYRQVLQADRFPAQAAVDLSELEGRIVLIGVTFTGNTDLRPTPFSSVYPMIGIQATLLDNLLNGEFIRPAHPAITYILWALVGGIVGVVAFAFRPLVSMALTLLVGGTYVAGAVAAFSYGRWHMELLGPLSALGLVYLSVNTILYRRTRRQKMLYLERMKYLGHLVESSHDAIMSFDLRGRVVSWNRGAERIYGFRERQVRDREWTFLVVSGERERLGSLFARAMEGEDVPSQEMTFRRHEGGSIPAEASVSQIRDSQGNLVGISLISQDLSEKKKMIEMLVNSEKLAEIGRMGSGIVHEIKNPLTSIMMMSGNIMANQSLPPKTLKYANIIEEESQRILRLSRNILTFARPQKPEMKQADINGILENTLELVEYELKKTKITVRRELKADMPPVWGDQEKLKQLFLNIIMNATHAMERGGVLDIRTGLPVGEELPGGDNPASGWCRCVVGRTVPEGVLVVRIEDRGTGIPPDLLEKVFEPFFSTKGEGKGTGLGLYISRNIVLEHRGRIEVSSKVGEGTVFAVFLPTAP